MSKAPLTKLLISPIDRFPWISLDDSLARLGISRTARIIGAQSSANNIPSAVSSKPAEPRLHRTAPIRPSRRWSARLMADCLSRVLSVAFDIPPACPISWNIFSKFQSSSLAKSSIDLVTTVARSAWRLHVPGECGFADGANTTRRFIQPKRNLNGGQRYDSARCASQSTAT